MLYVSLLGVESRALDPAGARHGDHMARLAAMVTVQPGPGPGGDGKGSDARRLIMMKRGTRSND